MILYLPKFSHMRYLLGLLLAIISFFALAQENAISRPDIPGELMVDIGLNYWDETPRGIDQTGWPSKSVGIYYSRRKPMSGKLSFYYGLGLGLEKIGLGNDSTLFSGDQLTVGDIGLESVEKNKLAISYFEIPLEIRLHPTGTQDGEGFFIGAGVIGGLRLNSHTKWKYNEDGQTKRQKISGEFDLNTWRYGFQVRLGFRGVHFFYKQYLSDTFRNEIGDVNPRLTTIGINLTGF